MSDLPREIAFMIRHPRQWWHDVTHTTCPVCGDELPARCGLGSPWQAHKARHGQQVWRDALRSGETP